jgi:signal transduction histidine kinase
MFQGVDIVTDREMELKSGSGEIRTCLISGSILSSNEMVISIMDITDRKKSQRTIEEANRKLNILGSITRHDTSNKLMILSGHLLLHQETLVEEKEKKRAEMMSDIVDSLSEQLDFADNYRRIGINSPEWQSVQKASEEAAAQFSRPDVTINIDSGGLDVLADPMLKKVFYNLIDNSLKHGGKITGIRIYSVVNEKDARIIYEDNGVGISQALKDKIFEEGYGRDHGLGLYLIREILMMTNIDIKETGTPGTGVRFEIVAPLSAIRIHVETAKVQDEFP